MVMQKPSHQHFGLGIFPLNAAHVITTRCFAMHIGHWAKINTLSESGFSGLKDLQDKDKIQMADAIKICIPS